MPRPAAKLLAAITAAMAILSCTEAVSLPNKPEVHAAAALEMQAGDSQFATVGHPVPINPTVVVLDGAGGPAQGVKVTFTVTSGGGSATGSEAVTDSAGFASVGSWTLGPELGTNTMTARVAGSDVAPFVFIATAMCDCWKSKGALNVRRIKAGSGVVNGTLYVLGGYNQRDRYLPVEEYDPASDTWTARRQMPPSSTAIAPLNGRFYIVGADQTSSTTVAPWLDSYDPINDTMMRHAPPLTSRTDVEAVAVGGRLYVLGGQEWGQGYLKTVEMYDPATDMWTLKAPMKTGRRFMAVAAVNHMLYVIGGEGKGPGGEVSQSLASVEAYDPATDKWSPKASLPGPLVDAAASVMNGVIYVVGGGPLYWQQRPYVYAYDPARNTWSVQPPMRTTRSEATASVLDGVLYVIGGLNYSDTSLALPTVEAYKP